MAQGDSGQLTNEQLALLDSLMYLDGTDKDHPGIGNKVNENHTLKDYLNSVDINKLPVATKDENGNISGEITSYSNEDWESLINAAKNDKQLSSLTIEKTLP